MTRITIFYADGSLYHVHTGTPRECEFIGHLSHLSFIIENV